MALEKIEHRGHDRHRVFRDWLDLMLTAHLSNTEHLRNDNFDICKPDTFFERNNAYEAEYMAIVERYKDDQPKENRAIDYFTRAMAALLSGLDDGDPLGDVYMAAITFGEHGQYFTPVSIATMMAEITIEEIADGQTVHDPTCGSGVMLLAAAKKNPKARLMGIDLDERCAKMAALNICLRELTGRIYWGNGLTGEMYTAWNMERGWITRNDKPAALEPRNIEPKKPAQLSLL